MENQGCEENILVKGWYSTISKWTRFSLLLAGTVLLMGSCGGDNDLADEDPTLPIETIIPNAGMDLYGMVRDEQGLPIEDVVVSDGYSCTVTDSKGIYQMKKNANAASVFYSTPAAYAVNTASETDKMASFYASLSLTQKRYDFTLKKLAAIETNFTLVCIGDPQVTNASEVTRFRTETMADIQNFVQLQDNPCYGLTMGDVVGDKPVYFNQMKGLLGSAEMPVFTTIGNHDKVATSNAAEPRETDDFTEFFGPINYSFNRGEVHFVCLDDVVFSNASTYSGGFYASQIEWLKQDLSYVPKNKMLIVYYHIPIRNSAGISYRTQMLSALSGFSEVHLMCGHTHYSDHTQITTPVNAYEHIHAAACGSWWRSTLNGDGTPNGYVVYEIQGPAISNWYYKPTKLNKEFQIRLHKGYGVFGGEYGYFTFGQQENTIVANIWNSDDAWKVEAYEDGIKVADLTPLSTTMKDAWTLGYHLGVLNRDPDNYSPSCKHLFLYTRINTKASLEIRATDRFGTVYTQNEVVSDYTTAISY
jgi:hypothetical protein